MWPTGLTHSPKTRLGSPGVFFISFSLIYLQNLMKYCIIHPSLNHLMLRRDFYEAKERLVCDTKAHF